MFSNPHILIIGLGSMGKRRIRNLKALGVLNLVGFDVRKDRCEEVVRLYNLPCYTNFTEAMKSKPDAWIISVPPDLHYFYMQEAVRHRIPAFVEAGVVLDHLETIFNTASKENIRIVPSCTLLFHPAIRKIFQIVKRGDLGKISNVIYHSGQYLPDWHTYEPVSSFYVSKKSTGGAREIVPFELTWLTTLFGVPRRIVGINKRTIYLAGAETIDDTYNLILDYDDFMVSMVVDVVSRHATRRLLINGDKKQLIWDWNENKIKVFQPEVNTWDELVHSIGKAEKGYNKNLAEQMYVDEMETFLKHVFHNLEFPHSPAKFLSVLQLLYQAEASGAGNNIQIVR